MPDRGRGVRAANAEDDKCQCASVVDTVVVRSSATSQKFDKPSRQSPWRRKLRVGYERSIISCSPYTITGGRVADTGVANLNFSNPTDFGLKSAAVGDRF